MEEQKEIKIKKPIYKRWWFILVAIIVVVVSIIGIDDEETKANTATNVKTEQTDIRAEQRKHQELVIEFEKQLHATEGYAKPALESYEQVMTDFENGKANKNKAFEATSNAKDAADVMYTALRQIEISNDLPQDVRGILDEAKETIRSAYFIKKEGLESTMEFLKNNKPSDLQAAKEHFQQSETYMLNGTAKLLEVKEKVGIN